MARFSSYGALDNQILEDADVAFFQLNNRLRPDQLKPGVLAESVNGRMGINGEWQPRKGIDLVVAPLSSGTTALTLPFDLPTLAQIGDGITAILNDNAVNAIYGSCLYSNPNSTTEAYLILAANTQAIAVRLPDGATTPIAYPATEVVSEACNLIQAFNKVFIFRDGKTAFEWNGVLTGSPAFTKVANGTYTQPVQYSTASNTVITGGKVTVTEVAHTLSVGDEFYVIDKGTTGLQTENPFVVAEVPSSSTFVFYADAPTTTATTVKYMQRQSAGLGYGYMPAPPWAVYHQRRLVMPYKYTQATVAGSTVYTSRGVSDEVIVSDILDSDTYDQVYGQLRFNAGTADYVVALHPFAEGKLVVFNRNSIHIVVNSGGVEDLQAQLITNEVGCLARKSVVQVADSVLFLSDNGVYGANFQDLYNLRGQGIPLSESIQGTIRRINKDYAHRAVATYFDNRYFLALPLDGSQTNNTLLVYNFLNQGWESIDSVDDVNWDITDIYVGGTGSARGLYVVSQNGGVHRLEYRDDGVDRIITQIGGTQQNKGVQSLFVTRMFTYGVTDRKKFNHYELQVQSSEVRESDAAISVRGENVDTETALGTLAARLGDAPLPIAEDASVRARIGGNRSYGLQFIVRPTQGRPRIRCVKIAASITSHSLTSIK